MTVWHVYHDPPMSGARNMAIDHALATGLADGTAALRLYEWSEPTVSLGRNEPARGRSGAVVRRPTGGRAVLHRSELTYAVAVPARALGGPRATYRAVNEALVEGLRLLGADVTLAPDGATLRPDAGPCFEAPAEGEVMAGGGKLVGSAQARIGEALLQHGSILIEDDQSTLGSASTARPLRALVGQVTVDDVREAVVEGFGRRFAELPWRPAAHDEALLAAADRLEAERYDNEEWTRRR